MIAHLKIEAITQRLLLRRVKAPGIALLKEKMARFGFQPQHPLLVFQHEDGTCELLDGNHRLEAARELGLTAVPVHILTGMLTDNEKKRLAREANETTEALIPTTFVDDAELIWKEAAQKKTQQEIAQILGWSRDKVAKYAALRDICEQAWNTIVTMVEQTVTEAAERAVTTDVTGVTFTENLLRDILPLTPDQQVELVQCLAKRDIKKARFTDLARAYHARNEMGVYALQHLGNVGEPFAAKLCDAIASGAYDDDWKTSTRPKLQKLLTALRDEWECKHSIHLICGDFCEAVKELGDGCIDLILTDPPYNIARENVFKLQERSPLSQDFGEWDKYADEEAFLTLFAVWAKEWARLLREQGSGYVFMSDRYLSDLRRALQGAGLHVKATIGWYKTNPGTQVVKTNYKSSLEYALFFTKGQGGHTFNWQGENEMHNLIQTPICGGNERLVDYLGKTLHPTQKPECLLRHFLEVSSNRGDTVFDGFAGVGSTGKVAKDHGRKFIGIEQEQRYFDAMQRRLAE